MTTSMLEDLRHKANRGSLKSKAKLGVMYFEGIEIKRDYRQAFELFRASSPKSDLAQFYIGEYHYKGYLFLRNYPKAFQIFQSVSQQNPKNPLAIKRLADCYFHGRGVERDVLLSLKIYYDSVKVGGSAAKNSLHSCFKKKDKDKHLQKIIQIIAKKSEEGDGFLQNILGIMYQEGNGLEKNKEVAFQWFKKSAKNNETTGMNNLAIAFHTGKGVKKNHAKSFKWFKRAAKLGYPSSVNNVGVCYLNGDGTEKDLKRAYKCFNRSLENGNILSCNSVGYMFLMGETIERNPHRAVKLFFKGDRFGNVNCTSSIGYCYTSSDGLPKDDKKAFQYFLKAAEQKDDQSMFNVGICYQKGQGIETDSEKAIMWIKRAALAGNAAAMNSLGVSYEFGQDVERNSKLALEWYRQSAEKDDRFGQFNLGRCYLDGCGTDINIKKGYEYVSKACDGGVTHASELLQGLNKLQFLIKGPAHFEQKLDTKILESIIQEDYEINFQNSKKKPLYYLQNEKLKNLYIQFNSLSSDFLKLFILKENCNCTINKIKLHKIWVELRLNKTINKLQDLLKSYNQEDLISFFKWVYSGVIYNCKITKSICKKLHIDIYQKSGRKGLVRDLKKLYVSNETKDFTIIVQKNNSEINLNLNIKANITNITSIGKYKNINKNPNTNNYNINISDIIKINTNNNNNNNKNKNENENENENKNEKVEKENKNKNEKEQEKEKIALNTNLNKKNNFREKNAGIIKIPVHQLILQARSNIFRGMFLNINDHKGQVGDYTGKSYKTLQILIKFLYYDSIFNEEMNGKIVEELQDAVDYYQLNENSYLLYQLNELQNNKNTNGTLNKKLKKKKFKDLEYKQNLKNNISKNKQNYDENTPGCICF
ncbi:erad-associated e3 ubiquitin-protein ligase component-related [Anaeramoeba flamelloides]|uniref:Erad-associated e3 ubiquitin-protein ligase component-related n=1 Tax=Anaeramoeba flamelloides TaxID=1746091 RepID=A0AAV7ZDU5_9EUKA|nr:erad-associated e3 ubiquitin-protein ligase component-related [Anaeramoeba flamelloides]